MSLIRQFFLHDLNLKGMSLLVAFLLWLQVSSQQTVQRTISVPVEVQNMPEGLEISNDYAKQIEVELRSNRGSGAFEGRQVKVELDLHSAQAGTETILLTDENVKRPAGLDLLSSTPDRIRLRLERTRKKYLDIDPIIVGEPAQGFEVTEVQVVPSQILVSGPESSVQKVSRARTEAIDITGHSSPVREPAYVDVEDPRLRIDNTVSVSVVVTIQEKRRKVKVKGVAVRIVPPEVQSRLYDKHVTLEGSVPLSYTGNLETRLFQAVVDLAGLQARKERYQLTPEIVVPEEYASIFRLEKLIPAKVRVRKIK
ncbi:MAG: YbbR-like domain-containing protein [Acidobacteriota bacterium]